ncbi:MAG: type IV pilus modification PilV family protein [Patescibacteria group bacterium]
MIKYNFQKNNQNKKGFTLIETFMAIVILTIAVLGPLSLFANAMIDARYARERATAGFLAREGLELLLADRWDYISDMSINFSQGYDYPNFVNQFFLDWTPVKNDFCHKNDNGCAIYIDNNGNIKYEINDGAMRYCEHENNNNRFELVEGDECTENNFSGPVFKRKIYFESVDGHQVKVISEVEWPYGGGNKTTKIVYYIFGPGEDNYVDLYAENF